MMVNRADITYCACARTAGRLRRMCFTRSAILVREHFRWKLLFLNIGPRDQPCEWSRSKQETQIAPGSKYKRAAPE